MEQHGYLIAIEPPGERMPGIDEQRAAASPPLFREMTALVLPLSTNRKTD
uniref:Uncharacterized protein n=1 Tax=Aegilops tauschii TaxID=37682 RepID=N1QSM4_AEGTA